MDLTNYRIELVEPTELIKRIEPAQSTKPIELPEPTGLMGPNWNDGRKEHHMCVPQSLNHWPKCDVQYKVFATLTKSIDLIDKSKFIGRLTAHILNALLGWIQKTSWLNWINVTNRTDVLGTDWFPQNLNNWPTVEVHRVNEIECHIRINWHFEDRMISSKFNNWQAFETQY